VAFFFHGTIAAMTRPLAALTFDFLSLNIAIEYDADSDNSPLAGFRRGVDR
jgi:hypothetical protein